jgi:calcyclin binding protein
MVVIEEMMDEEQQQQDNAALTRSQERISDADEIESALKHITRPSARLQVENLIERLRKEGKALERVASSSVTREPTKETAVGGESMEVESTEKPQPPIPLRTPATVLPVSTSKYRSFPTYYFDAGSYNSPTVSVYVPLDDIGSHDKSKISCEFTSSSFDLIVTSFQDGNDYRLLNDNLEHDIDVSKSKYIIKPNKIILKLGKIKGEYSYDHWTQLTAKKKKEKGNKKDDPAAGIMDLMKDMYESGDDNMKKMIGETMYKQRMGQLGKDGMGGLGGMDDFGI